MPQQARLYHLDNRGWYVETASGTLGPMETQQEAEEFVVLISKVAAARSETACTENECQ